MNKKNKKLFLKLFSLLFAFILWFYVLSSTNVALEKQVSVNYIVPDGFAIASKVPSEILFKINGPRAIINRLIDEKDSMTIDLAKDFSPTNRRYNISYLNYKKKFPFSVKIREVFPKYIPIYLIRESVKTVPIELDTEFSVNEEYEIKELVLDHKTARIEGAKNVLQDITSIKTEKLDLSGLNNSKVVSLQLVSPDNRVRMRPESVEAIIDVDKLREEILLQDVPIDITTDRRILSVSHRKVDLKVSAEKSYLPNDNAIRVVAPIPKDEAKTSFTVELKFILPPEVRLIESTVEKIDVKTGSKR